MKTGSVTSVCVQHIPLRDTRQNGSRKREVWGYHYTRDMTSRQTGTGTGTREAMRVIGKSSTSGPVVPHNVGGIIGRMTGRRIPIVVEGDWPSIPTYPVFWIYPER